MKLSDQAVACVMMALQKSLVEGSDVTNVLRGFELYLTSDGVMVRNPPSFKVETTDGADEALELNELFLEKHVDECVEKARNANVEFVVWGDKEDREPPSSDHAERLNFVVDDNEMVVSVYTG